MNRPYIITDANGNPVNGKYPPDREKYGDEFGGYKNSVEKILFYDFAVLAKGVSLIYNGVTYFLYKYRTLVIAYNASLKEVIKEYENEVELIENFSIDNIPFVELIDKISDVKVYENVFKQHVICDENGYLCNSKYPPNREKYGDSYNGYKSSFEETLFYNFGVQYYDLYFKYKGKEYFVLNEPDHVALCDEHYTKEYEVYANEMEFIENFKIDGKTLIELIDEIEEMDPM